MAWVVVPILAGLWPAGAARADGGLPSPQVTRLEPSCPGCAASLETFKLAQRMVLAGRYPEARALLAMLEQERRLDVERAFLQGYILVEAGDLKGGEKKFRQALDANPEMTQARLELARALYLQGHMTAADYHLRVSQRDTSLPPQIAATISQYRRAISDNRPWRLNASFGIAPDTNFTSAAPDRSVDLFGLPYDPAEDVRRKSGVGKTVGLSGSVRLPLGPSWSMGVEAAGRAANYRGSAGDEGIATLAIGPERDWGDSRARLAATVTQRWYGGKAATRLAGVQLSASRDARAGSLVGLELSARAIDNLISDGYDGWQFGAALSYERPISRALAGAVSLFAKREQLRLADASNLESGLSLGLGGELPLGLNAGASVQLSRVWFGADRADWRFEGRASLGLRAMRLMGFAPLVSYSYASNGSTLGVHEYQRHRVEFSFSRAF